MNSQKTCLGLVLVGLLLAPILGGQLSTDASSLFLLPGQILPSLFQGPETPILQHWLIATFFLIPLTFMLLTRRVVQTPQWRVMVAATYFILFLGGSVMMSAFKSISFISFLEWTCYLASMYAMVVCLGRLKGPRIALGAIVVGAAIVAIIGIKEYGAIRAIDPTWRIFAGWINTNALAGMLLLAIFPALSLLQSSEERIEKLGWGAAITVIGLALILTQSKGGFLAFGAGMVVFAVFGVWLLGFKKAAVAMSPLLILVVLAGGLMATPKKAGESSALTRVANSEATAVQSSGHRTLLWKTAIDLTKARPIGTGMNTFRFESARPGRTTATHLAHNTFLQLAAEASPLALIAFLTFLAMWAKQCLSGIRNHEPEKKCLIVGVIAAVCASLAHNMVDSDLYHFGTGILFFSLLGIALQLCPDGSGPELFPRPLRLFGILAGCGLAFFGLFYFGYTEAARARLNGDLKARDRAGVEAGVATLKGLPVPEGENFFLIGNASLALQSADAVTWLEKAVAFAPSVRNTRLLGRTYSADKDLGKAISNLNAALYRDPNNLRVLRALFDLETDPSAKKKLAERAIAVENTTYFQVRAIPELVETATADFREELAVISTDPTKQKQLRKEADAIYLKYAETTWPFVKPALKVEDAPSVESAQEVKSKMEQALAIGQKLASAGEPAPGAEAATRVLAELAEISSQ